MRMITESGWDVDFLLTHCSDSQSADQIATGERCLLSWAKQVDLLAHYLQDLTRKRVIAVSYVGTKYSDANVLTTPFEPSGLNNQGATMKNICWKGGVWNAD